MYCCPKNVFGIRWKCFVTFETHQNQKSKHRISSASVSVYKFDGADLIID